MELTPEQILVVIGLLLAAWYLFASIYNRRRGHRAYRWLTKGLPVLGEGYEGKWLGSAASGAHLTVARAVQPFRRVEVIYLLESRELLPLWLVDLIRNKRDQLIFKAVLRTKHQAEVEIAPASSRLARRIGNRADETWTINEDEIFFIAKRGKDGDLVLTALEPILATYRDQLRSISWSKGKPDIIAIFSLAPLLTASENAAGLFTALQNAVEQLNLNQSD